MRTRKFTLMHGTSALTFAGLVLVMNQALAAEYWLKAAPTTAEMPDPLGGPAILVPMWGYASCTDGTFATCSAVTAPGPALTVPAADTTLTVHLQNGLTVPTSLVVNGMIKPMTPVWDNGLTGPRPNGTARVRSFDAEAAPGGTADYQWLNVRPGTYLYQSGTQTQVQVQMGLYGAASKNTLDPVPATPAAVATSGQVYPGGTYAFDNEATLLYSEIDPVLHTAIANGSYGTTGPTSTINYAPKYFLINGKPFPYGAPIIEPVGSPGTTLLRLLNAGLTTHVPMVVDRFWQVIGEDGKPYPYRRNQYTALLPAAKTLDILFTPEVGATYPIMDRRLGLSNAGLSNGGMLAFLRFGSLAAMTATTGTGTAGGNTPPTAVADTYNTVPGATLNVPAAGVLLNDTDPDLGQTVKAVAAKGNTTGGGSYALNANGSFSYSPAPGFTGLTDSFSYNATDGMAVSAPATVTLNVVTPLAPAMTLLDNFDRADTVNSALGLGASWSQTATTNSPPDLQIFNNAAYASSTAQGGQAVWNVPDPQQLTLCPLNTVGFCPNQYASFTTNGSLENSALILKATGGDTAASPSNFVRVRYEVTGPGTGAIVVATMMGGAGAEFYVKQAAFPTAVSTGSLTAMVDATGLVTVFQNSNYLGGVQLPDVGAWKGGGRIGIQLQTPNAAVDDFSGGSL